MSPVDGCWPSPGCADRYGPLISCRYRQAQVGKTLEGDAGSARSLSIRRASRLAFESSSVMMCATVAMTPPGDVAMSAPHRPVRTPAPVGRAFIGAGTCCDADYVGAARSPLPPRR